jgi:predicted nucleotidyltransferase
VLDVLKAALVPLAPRIDVALVFGSMARGEPDRRSDVDILIVGAVSFAEVVAAVGPAQETLGREINPAVYPRAEFRAKLAAGHHFLTSVLRGPLLPLIGEPGELEGLAGEWLADPARDERAGDRRPS